MKKILVSTTWWWRVLPIGLLIGVRVYKHLQSGYLGAVWSSDLFLVVGWVIGWLLAEADHLFYATMCNPQELTCQRVRAEIGAKNWRNAWGILKQTEAERTKLPIRNILTAFVMTGVGLWLALSGASTLATGTALGFSVRLLSEILADRNYHTWYWLFARKFEEAEHKGLMAAWIAALIWQWSTLARG